MKRIVLDLDYCIGCRSCESACAARFQEERRIRYGLVEKRMGGDRFVMPLACRHCEDALCLKSCPFGVIRRDEETGVIFQSGFECIGCSSCILACPFGVIERNLLRHISQKCDLCRDRKEGPRCVDSCVSGALKYLSEEEVPKEKIGVRVISRSPYWRRVK